MKLWGSPSVTKFILPQGSEGMTAEQVSERLQREMATQELFQIQYWPIHLLTNPDEIIGCCGLRPKEDLKIIEMGIHLREEYWGQGIAHEACQAVIEHAFTKLSSVNAIFAGHNPLNVSSAKLLQKLGFCYTHDEYYEPTGLNHPSYLLTREHYEIRMR